MGYTGSNEENDPSDNHGSHSESCSDSNEANSSDKDECFCDLYRNTFHSYYLVLQVTNNTQFYPNDRCSFYHTTLEENEYGSEISEYGWC